MSFVDLDKPAVGEATKKSLIDAVIDDLSDLNARLVTVETDQVVNGSFEYDANADDVPDGWDDDVYNGAAWAIETTTVKHGRKAVKGTLTSTLGSRAVLTSSDYLPCAPGERYEVELRLKGSTAGLKVKGEVLWYYWTGAAFAAATTSSSEALAEADAPTSWGVWRGSVLAPAGTNEARFYRLRLTVGATGGTTAGNVLLDGVQVRRYHGPVWLNPVTEACAAGTNTFDVDYTDDALPRAVGLTLVASDEDPAGLNVEVQGWAAGAWRAWTELSSVPLNVSGQFRVVTTNQGAEDTVQVVVHRIEV